MYPSVPGFDVPLGKGGCTQKCSVIRSCQVPCRLKRSSRNCFCAIPLASATTERACVPSPNKQTNSVNILEELQSLRADVNELELGSLSNSEFKSCQDVHDTIKGKTGKAPASGEYAVQGKTQLWK